MGTTRNFWQNTFSGAFALKMSICPEEICDNGIEVITTRVDCSNGLFDERFKGGE